MSGAADPSPGWYLTRGPSHELHLGYRDEEAYAAAVRRLVDDKVASRLAQRDKTLWGEAAEGATARRLEAPVHTPLLVFRRVSSAAGRPVEYVVSRYRGDRYQVHMSLGATPGATGKPRRNSTTRRDPS